jgi:hypothetical protein
MALSPQARIPVALVVIVVVWRFSAYILRQFLIRKFTVTEDIQHLGKARIDGQRIRGNAVICGGRYVPVHCGPLYWDNPLSPLMGRFPLRTLTDIFIPLSALLDYGQHASVRITSTK